MKPEMVTLKVGQATIKMPASVVAQSVLAGVLTNLQPVPAPLAIAAPDSIPPLGSYWPERGGHNGGFVPAREGVPAHYLIIATQDVGSHAWGGSGNDSGATSKWDGLVNTQVLLDEGDHPAAKACAEYQADGHSDFYLPAAAELYQGWLNTPELFANDCWYWSSSQRSAYYAFCMHFGGGTQDYDDKGNEFRVRPVRRFDSGTLSVPGPSPGLLRLPALEAQQRQRAGIRRAPGAEPYPAAGRVAHRHVPARAIDLLRRHSSETQGGMGRRVPGQNRPPPVIQPHWRWHRGHLHSRQLRLHPGTRHAVRRDKA